MRTINDLHDGRDNNFLLLRFVAAASVMLSHSYYVSSGKVDSQPLLSLTGFDLGFHAVNVFFVLSGFLIAQSWETDPKPLRYAWKRFTRIFPALIICVFVTAFLLGPLTTTRPLSEYFSDSATFAYFFETASLVSEDRPLPGVFNELPASGIVNGSLWTLRYEFACYVGVAALGLLGLFRHRPALIIFFLISLVGLALIGTTTIGSDTTLAIRHVVRFGLTFGLGMAAYFFRNRIPLTFFGVIVFVALAVIAHDTKAYRILLYPLSAYAALWVAFVPKGAIREVNNFGDYSYGIYIFAFPTQQFVMHLLRIDNALVLFALSFSLVLPISIASWHLIEKPSLKFGREHMRRNLTSVGPQDAKRPLLQRLILMFR